MAVFLVGAASKASGTVESTASHTTYLSIGTNYCNFVATTETNVQTKWTDAGTFKNLYVNVITNTWGTNPIVRFRVGAINGNQSVSITANTTGVFSDLVDTDIVTAGALVNYQQSTGTGAGNLLCNSVTNSFAPSSGAGAMFNTSQWSGSTAISSTITNFCHPSGILSQFPGSENNGSATRLKACTVSQFYMFLTNSNLSNTTPCVSRIGGVNGNNSISIPASTAGLFRDTTDSDVIADNSQFDWQVDASGSASGLAHVGVVGAWMETSNFQNISIGQVTSLSTGTGTQFVPFMGEIGTNATEANVQMVCPDTFFWRFLRVITISNPSVNITYVSRKNGSNGNQSVSILSGTNGTFEDTVDSDTINKGDLVNSAFVMGASTAISWNVATNQLGQVAPAVPVLPRRRVRGKNNNFLFNYNAGGVGRRRFRRFPVPIVPPGPSGGVHQEIVWFGVRAIVVENTNQAGRMLGFTLNSTSADFSLIMAELNSKEDAYVANNP